MRRPFRVLLMPIAIVAVSILLLSPHPGPAVQGVWTRGADMPTARTLAAATVVDGKIYVIGGTVGRGTTSWSGLPTVEVYDPATDTWSSRADMPTPRGALRAVAIDGKIYAFGGDEGGTDNPGQWRVFHLTNVLEVYDPATDTWEARAPMLWARYWHLGVAIDRTILAIGGRKRNDGGVFYMLSTAEAYDPSADTWTERAPMPFETTARGVVLEGRAYVFGGRDDPWDGEGDRDAETACLEYDPGVDAWTWKSPRPTKRADSFAAAAVRGTAYLFGGRDQGGYTLASVEAYEPAADTWTRLGDMPQPIRLAASAVVDGRVYVIGGREENADLIALDLSTLCIFEPARPHLIASCTRDVSAVAGNEWQRSVEVVLEEPFENGTYPSLWVDLSPAGHDGIEALAHTGEGRYRSRLRATFPRSGQFSVPVRTGTPDSPGMYLYSVELGVWPGGPMDILSEDMATGWQAQIKRLEQLALVQSATVCTGASACAVRTRTSSTGWTLSLEPDDPVDHFGYDGLHLAFHPGDLNIPDWGHLKLRMEGGTETIDLLNDDRVDLSRPEWQEFIVSLDEFGIERAISAVQLSGNSTGTLYLDDVALVAGPPPPITAVLETRTEALPGAFALRQNYPNPFNSHTVIGFSLPAAADVDLALFDLLGQRVTTMVRGHRPAGTYTLQWDGRDDGGQPLASGLYLYRLQSTHQTETRKLLLVR